jgi:hypothetical protein
MRFEPPPYFSNKKVTAKAIAIALAFSFAGTRQVVAGVTAGALVLGPSLVNAFGSQNPISPALCGQAPPKNTPIISSPAKPFSGASRRQKLLRTGLLPIKDPATGELFLRLEDPKSGISIKIDGKGKVVKVTDPAAPRSETPALNKSSPSRAGPMPQDLNLKTDAALAHRPSWKSERIITPVERKTTTLIGSFKNDMKSVLGETNYPQSTNFGPKDGGFNLLNVPKDKFNADTFWKDYNEPWLKQATARGDDVLVLSNPHDSSLLVRNGEPTNFAKEVGFMEEQVKLGRYRYILAEGKYVPTR